MSRDNRAASDATKSRHARKCEVCAHPDRDAIEHEFLHWCSPARIASEYQLSHWSTLYRHAHGTGLFARRRRNLRGVIEKLLERVHEATITGETILRAVRAHTILTDDNKWNEPPKRVRMTHVIVRDSRPSASGATAASADSLPAAGPALLPPPLLVPVLNSEVGQHEKPTLDSALPSPPEAVSNRK